MKAGITGHRKLVDASGWVWVRGELEVLLRELPEPLTGVTSLAIGADQLFAEVVLNLGGEIGAVIPFSNYERTFDDEFDLARYRDLLSRAQRIEIQANSANDDEAYLKAGERVAELCDVLVAVWDGEPSRGLGGTADIVRYASSKGKRVIHLNPITRQVGNC